MQMTHQVGEKSEQTQNFKREEFLKEPVFSYKVYFIKEYNNK